MGNHFDERDLENTVFDSTFNARMNKCKQQTSETISDSAVCNLRF